MGDAELQLQLTRRKNHPNIKIFNFHQVSDKFNDLYHARGTYTSTSGFKSQIKSIKKKYSLISLQDAVNQINENKINDNYACVTIDDGDSSIINAADILFDLKVPATFFINSAYLENQETSWYRIVSFLENHPKYHKLLSDEIRFKSRLLRKTEDSKFYRDTTSEIYSLYTKIAGEYNGHTTRSHLQTISQHGFGIGPHGHRHERFNLFDKKWQLENIRKDCENLSVYKTYCNFFALPFGRYRDFNLDTQNAAFEAGVRMLLSTGGANSFNQPFIHRIPSDSRKFHQAEIQDQEMY
jgi:peptidoglycan/xylan/chitin deacetylase (PgdA/CDA1 family)